MMARKPEYSRAQFAQLAQEINSLVVRRFGGRTKRCWVSSYPKRALAVRIWGDYERLELSQALELREALENLWVKGISFHG